MLARRVKLKGEPVLFVGVPLMTPALRVAQEGNEPARTLNVGAGEPVAVTVNVPAVLTEKLAAAALEMVGANWTVRVAGIAETTAVAMPLMDVPPTPLVTSARN